MKRTTILLCCAALIGGACGPSTSDNGGTTAASLPSNPKNPRVEFKTTLGNFTVELFADKAPISVKNFLKYVDDKFYDDTIFHRTVTEGIYVVQAGGYDKDRMRKQTRAPIKNEADNGVKNLKGTLSLARTTDLNSATSQFFINVRANPPLDHVGPERFGYAVFGRVISGLDVVQKIYAVPTENKGGAFATLPVPTPVITSARRLP